MMLKIYFTMGLPASGKTTWAKKKLEENPNGIKRVSKDDLRAMLDGGRYSSDAEKFILKARDALIELALVQKKHVIVDDTNLSNKHLARVDQLAGSRATVEIVDFTDVDVETCVERDQGRPNYVGEKVIRRMHREFLAKRPEVSAHDPDLPDAVIVDIDGTLAIRSDRGVFEFEKLEHDAVNEPVKFLLWSAIDENAVKTIFVSGREDKYREPTIKWLEEKGLVWYRIYMRKTGDVRRDDVIKREIYEEHIKGKYNVLFCLDDRDRTVRLWRSLGLTCFQVADGDF